MLSSPSRRLTSFSSLQTLAVALVFGTGCQNTTPAPPPEQADKSETSSTTGSATDVDTSNDTTSKTPIVDTDWACLLEADDERPTSIGEIGCFEDFEKVAADPLTVALSGAQSVKFIIDTLDDNALYFQDSEAYPIHFDFASKHLSGKGLPVVPPLGQFNETEYYSSTRRFLLGAVTFYENPQVWALEFAGYDTASTEMIQTAYDLVSSSAYFGGELYVHPLSEANKIQTEKLPDTVPVITNEELYAGIDYQPLNFAESIGKLLFVKSSELESAFVNHRDIVVLDTVPNDISVVMGIITAEFQTPLSHINVLSKNRNTPNMGLRNAHDNEELRALEGKWVKLNVNPLEYAIEEVTEKEADAWWEANKPSEIGVPSIDLTITDLRDIKDLVDVDAPDFDLKASIKAVIPAFGGKASHYSPLAQIEGVPVPKAFAIPIFYYDQFMEENGFKERINTLLADSEFENSAQVRDLALKELRDDMKVAPVNAEFEALLLEKLATDYPGTRMRFRSSTNAEDLDGFTGAGLYTSKSGDPNDPESPVLDAVRKVWASVWKFRAFEERSYRSIDHTAVGMAILSHRSFPEEEANGVAITGNPFDTPAIDPAFYINVQFGESSVVLPEPGVTSDQLLYYYDKPNQPIVYLDQSSLTEPGTHVLTNQQAFELGTALKKIHEYFYQAYGTKSASAPDDWFYAMDIEFKFDGEPGETPVLFVKQARPYGG